MRKLEATADGCWLLRLTCEELATIQIEQEVLALLKQLNAQPTITASPVSGS